MADPDSSRDTLDGPIKASLIGRSVDGGRYTIQKLIGEGGMGVVYQARQTSMDRMVAMKILRAQLAMDAKLLARFKQEALSVSRLRHPNTITVYDYGRTDDGLLFIAMELLGGQSLFDLLRLKKRLPLSEALHIMTQVCGAVAEAHQLGVVHRDLKPENIQIDSVGGDDLFAKVLDFGIAKIVHGDGEAKQGKTLTMAGAIFGTPAYMSPEQVHGEKVDHRADVYAMGVILYELLAGRQPFVGATPMAIMMAQASKAAPPIAEVCPEADVVPEVLAVIDRCLQKARDDRYATADELLRALQTVQMQLGDISRSRMIVKDALWSTPAAVANREAMGSAPTLTPLEDMTPAAGHIATIPPPDALDDDEPIAIGSGRKGLWWAMGAVLLIGGVAAYVATRPAPADPAPAVDPPASEAIETVTYKINSIPQNAAMYEGSTRLGQTPLTQTWTQGTRKQLRLELEGYEPQTIEALAAGNAVEERVVTLQQRVVKMAPFRIRTTPPGAEVTADGTAIGRTSDDNLVWIPTLGKGAVKLDFRLDGHAPQSTLVDRQAIDLGAVEVHVALKPLVAAPTTTAPVTESQKPTQKPAQKPKRVTVRKTPRRTTKRITRPKIAAPATQAAPPSVAPPSKAPPSAPVTEGTIYKKM